ncbi:TonB-dependent receptor [Sphingobium olei]|uniref:TonB-dependent receptor n=1 Tax=Sphingobium olei TaxID=420955 RepID=A0ABW3P5F6_9SPHN
MHQFRHTVLRAALLAGVSFSVAQVAHAQTGPETAAPAADEPDAIVVTGIRASLASAAKVKRDSVLIVDSISAEDVGKLPDVSIADSLARLPGVTAQRLEGRDQRLSIRGLGPDFSTTLLNGREQVTVGDNRGVEYDQYPSEFFQNVNVYKSADAALIAAGISGTVDLRMLRPLDKNDRILAVSLRGQMNGMDKLNPDGQRYGYRASATYVDQFANDTLGLSLGFAASQTPSQNERFNAWGYPTDAAGNLIIGGAKPYVQSNLLKRYGVVGTLEWQPSDTFHSTFDVLASHFEEVQRLRGIEFPLVWGSNVGVSNVMVDNGFVTGATFSNVYGVQRNDYNKRKADTISLGWNNAIRLNDSLKLNVDASWSRAKRTDFLLETYSGTGYLRSGVPDTVRVERQSNGLFSIVPTLDYTNTNLISLTDPNGWGYNGTSAVVQAGFLNRPKFTDDMKSFRANLIGDISGSIFSNWEVGGNYSRRKKTSAYTSYFLCPTGGTDCTIANGTPGSAAVPQQALLGKNVSLDYLGVPAMLTLDPLYLYDNVLDAVFDNRPSSLVRDNVVKEDVFTGYAKMTLDGDLGGKPLKGAIGLQVIHTRQASTGTISNFANGVVTVVPASGKESFTDFLPSAQLSVELEPGFFVKIGAAQTMVRPRMDQERVNQEYNFNLANVGLGSDPQYSPFSSNGGNIALRPYQSTNIDLSVEKYFTGGGYLSLAGFFKNLTDFVDPNNNIAYDFSGVLPSLPAPIRDQIVADGSFIGLLKAPANTGKGTIMGVEGTASLPFKVFSETLDGFGIFASGSYTHSEVKYGSNPTDVVTLPGLSKWVASGTAYYEKSGFQARVSYRYRSSFLGEVAGLSAAPTFRTAKAEGILDAQIGYEFQSGPLTGLSILLQGKNLTDQPFVTYQNDDKRQVIDYQRYGRDYYLGLTYKF